MNKPPRLAVFDCDGTLLDSQHSIIAAMGAAFETHGFAPPRPENVRRIVGLPLIEGIARLLPDAGHETHGLLTQSYKDAFMALRQAGAVHEPLFPGVGDCLDALEDGGWLLGLATGKARRGVAASLGPHRLFERFVTVQTSDNPPGKPHPEMLLRAMTEAGTEARDTVMIGDTTYDISMARNAGTMALAVAWGYHETDELRAAGAHMVVGAFAEVAEAIEILWEANS